MLKRMARGVRDGAIAIAIRSWLNDRYGEYGKVSEVSLDVDKGTLRVTALLHGERDSITATVDRFTLHNEDGEWHVLIHSISASRAWLGQLLNRLGAGKRLPLPASVARLL
jgi:hypothetical protein